MAASTKMVETRPSQEAAATPADDEFSPAQ
jgi:hypothetical protein